LKHIFTQYYGVEVERGVILDYVDDHLLVKSFIY